MSEVDALYWALMFVSGVIVGLAVGRLRSADLEPELYRTAMCPPGNHDPTPVEAMTGEVVAHLCVDCDELVRPVVGSKGVWVVIREEA